MYMYIHTCLAVWSITNTMTWVVWKFRGQRRIFSVSRWQLGTPYVSKLLGQNWMGQIVIAVLFPVSFSWGQNISDLFDSAPLFHYTVTIFVTPRVREHPGGHCCWFIDTPWKQCRGIQQEHHSILIHKRLPQPVVTVRTLQRSRLKGNQLWQWEPYNEADSREEGYIREDDENNKEEEEE